MGNSATAAAPATAANLLRIGQLAEAAGFDTRTIRYYETLGLLKPQTRTASNYRLYGAEALERLRLVRGARALGLRLADIRAILDASDLGEVTCEHVLATLNREIARTTEHIQRLRELHGQLLNVKARIEEALQSGIIERGCICPCISDPID